MVEESKEQPPTQSQLRRQHLTYNPQMPKLSCIAMMSPNEALAWLSTLDASIYKGFRVSEILEHITTAEA